MTLRFITQNAGLLVMIGSALVLVGSLLSVPASRRNVRLLRYPAVLFLLAGAVGLVSGLFGAAISAEYRWSALGLVSGGLIVLIGGVLLILESRRKAPIKQGGLIMSIGLLTGVSSILLPVLPGQLAPIAYQSPTPTASTPTRTPPPTRTAAVTLTLTIPPSQTLPPTPLPTLTTTPTRGLVPVDVPVPPVTSQLPSGSATAELIPIGGTPNAPIATLPIANPVATVPGTPGVVSCTVTPFRNVNLRVAPSSDSALITTIPFGTALTATGQTNQWWKVRYEQSEGWITAQFVQAAPDCTKLPIVRP